jgi:cob(I)alamin adenosyltransferase
MTSRETWKASKDASADARIEKIRQSTEQSIAQINEMKAAPEQIAAQLQPLASSLADLSTEFKVSVRTMRSSVENLPETYATRIKEVTEKAERSLTSLYNTTMQVRDQAMSVANFAKEIDRHQRRGIWRAALIVGILASLPPTIICLAIAQATGNPPLKLLKALVGI